MYKCYQQTDATIVEVNPLIITDENKVIVLDTKMNFDDNALFRQKKIKEMRDLDEEDPMEIEAGKFNLNYIKLDGNVGCMVNGAGLAMATMDIIKLAGGDPANFLDVGGTANAETVKNGFRIILSDRNVKAILINIFGGIVRCDRVANGVIEAVKELGLEVIYGDTDSIMINTRTDDLAVVKDLGLKVKKAVNKRYRLLELELFHNTQIISTRVDHDRIGISINDLQA